MALVVSHLPYIYCADHSWVDAVFEPLKRLQAGRSSCRNKSFAWHNTDVRHKSVRESPASKDWRKSVLHWDIGMNTPFY